MFDIHTNIAGSGASHATAAAGADCTLLSSWIQFVDKVTLQEKC
jgi:hypothetical protein